MREKWQQISWSEIACVVQRAFLLWILATCSAYWYAEAQTLSFYGHLSAGATLLGAVSGLRRWIRAAGLVKWAETGDREAQYQLGLMYENGIGVPQQAELAQKWLQRAAKQGHREAQEKLAAGNADGPVA